jgi:hypothetical protein
LARAGVNRVFHFAYDNFQKYIIGQEDIKTGKPRADDLVEKAGIQGALRTFGKIGEAAGSLLPFVPRNGLDAAITAGLYFSPVVNGFVATAIGTASAGITLPSAVFIAGNLIFAGVLTRAVPIFGGISPTIRKILGRIPGLHDYPGDAREDVKAILARVSAKVGK